MLRVIISFIVLYSLISVACFGAENETFETGTKNFVNIDRETINTKTKDFGNKMYDQKEKTKQRVKYFKQKKRIEILEKRRNKKQQEIEYLEKRLELKKDQLESFNFDTEKGEKVK